MMKKRVISTGLSVGLSALIAGLSIHLMKAEGQSASPHSSTLQSEAWPTPWLNLQTPSLSVSRSEVGHWVDNMPQLHDRATNARRLRRQGLRALANQRPCAAGMVLRRSFELEPWPREIAEHLENLELAYRQCGWVREAEDLGRVSITYFPTSYRAYVAEKELARPEQTPAFIRCFNVGNLRRSFGFWMLGSSRAMSSIFAAPLKIGDGNLLALLAPMSWLVPESWRSIPMRPVWLDSSIVFRGSALLIQGITLSGISVRCALHFVTAQRAARRYGVPLSLVMGVMRQESAFSSKAESSAGALGLMQIMPLTGQYLARVPMSEPWDPAILLEPSVNVMLGVKYLSELQNRFGDLELVLAAYNAGPSAVQRWLNRRPEDLAAFVEAIPYDETRDYVVKVISWMRRFEAVEEQRMVRLNQARVGEAS